MEEVVRGLGTEGGGMDRRGGGRRRSTGTGVHGGWGGERVAVGGRGREAHAGREDRDGKAEHARRGPTAYRVYSLL